VFAEPRRVRASIADLDGKDYGSTQRDSTEALQATDDWRERGEFGEPTEERFELRKRCDSDFVPSESGDSTSHLGANPRDKPGRAQAQLLDDDRLTLFHIRWRFAALAGAGGSSTFTIPRHCLRASVTP